MAPSYVALWITDDVLAIAWRRFTHVYNNSHTQRRRINGGKRHGSNVPGPLESRRRLAKRRMGLESHSQPPNGGGGDFGALFGFGTRGATSRDAEKGWKWEAPKSQQAVELASKVREGSVWSYGWPGGKPKRKEQELETLEKFLRAPVEEVLVEDAPVIRSEVEEVHMNPVLASSDSFGKLLANLDRIKRLKTDDMADVIAFLQSSADETGARNTSRLLEWLERKGPATDEVMDLVMAVIVSKIRLGTLPTHDSAEILKTFAHALWPIEPDFAQMHVLLRALQQRDLLSKVCATTTRLLLEQSPDVDELTIVMDLWLSCLRSFEAKGQLPSFDLVWHGVYEQLSQKYTRPAVFRKHLSELDSELLALILLHYWVPHVLANSRHPDLHLDGEEDGGAYNIIELSSKRRISLPRGDASSGVYTKRIHRRPIDPNTDKGVRGATNIGYRTSGNDFENVTLRLSFPRLIPTHITRVLSSYLAWRSKGLQDDYRHSALVDLLATLAHYRLPYAAFACDIFSILTYPSSTGTHHDILDAYRWLGVRLDIGVPSALGTQLIDYFLSTKNLRYALFVFRSIPGIPLSKYHALPIAIAEDSSVVPSSAVWYALNRIAREDYTPRPALGAAEQPLILPPSQIDLVHRVAFAFAKQEQLSPRVAFRRVWECYRFLKDRAAPIKSLISRAFVTSGVIRPLKMGIRVATEQLRFTLTVVEMVEGKDVAEQLDRKVMEIWQGSVLPEMLKAKELGIEEVCRGAGAERWRSITWAGVTSGENKRVHVRKCTEIVDSDAVNRYEPLASSDGDGYISKPSPRAGVDSWDVLASSKAWNEESANSKGLANEFDVCQDITWPDDEFPDASIEPSLRPEPPIRRGLGYNTPKSEAHASSAKRELGCERDEKHELIGQQVVPDLDSSDTTATRLSASFSAKKREARCKELVANLEAFYAIEEQDIPYSG